MTRLDRFLWAAGLYLLLATGVLYAVLESAWEYRGPLNEWRRNRLKHEVQYRDFRHGGYRPAPPQGFG